MILKSFSQLFFDENRQPLCYWLSQLQFSALVPASSTSLEIRVQLFHLGLIISTLEIALANSPRDVLVLLNVADVHQCSKVDFPYLLFLCALFMTSFHSFSIVAFASGINIPWDENLLFILLGFPRHASLRDRSPESSEPYVILVSSKFAEQNNIRSSYLFLPRFTLESILHSHRFWGLLEEFLSHRYAVPRDETTCACFHLHMKIGWICFLQIFSSERILAQCCNEGTEFRPFPATS